MRILFTICLILGQYCFTGCLSSNKVNVEASSSANPIAVEGQVTDGYYEVVKVIDGDTFWVDRGTGRFKVRFIGVDAPETRNTRWKEKGALANEAKQFVEELTFRKQVKLELDVQKKDRYQRVLAYVYLADGRFLNAELVKRGYAVVSTYPPNIKYVDLFTKLQIEAREQQLGVWQDQDIL